MTAIPLETQLVRKAEHEDIPFIIEKWKVSQKHYEKLKPDYERQKKVLRKAITDYRSNYCCVVGEKGKPLIAVLVGVAVDNIWAQRRNCNLILWESSNLQQAYDLVDNFKEWLPSVRSLSFAWFLPDQDSDKRGELLAEKGFVKSGGAHILWNC